MILKTTKRAISEIRQQPLIGALTIFGTAFAVFLAMVVMMTAKVKLTPFAPESCRDLRNTITRRCLLANGAVR